MFATSRSVLSRADFGASAPAARALGVGGAASAFKLPAHTKTIFDGQEQADIDNEIYSGDVGLVGGLGRLSHLKDDAVSEVGPNLARA